MKTTLSLLILLLAATAAAIAAPPAEDGKAIFSSRCAACHNIHKDLTGPALAGLDQRRPLDWIVKFVQSSQSLVKSGDKTAVALFEKHNKIVMPDHTDLGAEQIRNIVEYIKAEGAVAKETAPFAKPGKLRPAYLPTPIGHKFFIGFLAVVLLLVGVLLFAVQLKQFQRNQEEA
ncbi:cytochrome c [Flaviaesturariibacter amylovorans]|uniref:Cytochrome c domain-containing protein n=1 Tax=Flaviaesturariibacter amylovorans TaxID=1084520 RepID=A0ABP8GYW9_9BACT